MSERRSYESPVRRQRAAETRERIVQAGSELAHSFETWNWDELTFRAVAEQAGVGERTVYRHFPTERHLHDAVMRQLETEAGVDYEQVSRTNLAEVTERVFASLPAFETSDTIRWPDDPTFNAVDERRHAALLHVIDEIGLSEEDREGAAALLDVLWNLPALEHMVARWRLDPTAAAAWLTWTVELVLQALEEHDSPLPGG